MAPVRARSCAFLTRMKAMEEETNKLSKTLPDDLKHIAEAGVRAPVRRGSGARQSLILPLILALCVLAERHARRPAVIRQRSA